MRTDYIDLSFVLPGWNENRWSDLLATLITADPKPMSTMLGVEVDGVRREVAVPRRQRESERLDLLLTRGGAQVAALEVKVLSDLGRTQLERYSRSFPDMQLWAVLHLRRLPVSLRGLNPWRGLAWEDVLEAYARSSDPWVATTSRAWVRQLDDLVPPVDADTVWNDVPDAAPGFGLALRARIAWLAGRLDSWCELDHGIEPSSGGSSWAVLMSGPSATPGHTVSAELQEGLSAVQRKHDPQRPYRERVKGPEVLLGLRQWGTDTSADFNWRALHRVFAGSVLDEQGVPKDGRAWLTHPAQPRITTDRDGHELIVSEGAPRWLGKGWGMKVAKSANICHFGARFRLSPDSTMAQVEDELRRLVPLIQRMATL